MSRRFQRVIATEMTEQGVELLLANNEANGAVIDHVARLDVLDRGGEAVCGLLLDGPGAGGAAGGYVVCACDIFYDERVIEAILECTAALRAGAPGSRVRLLIARSANFDHNDAFLLRASRRHGLEIRSRLSHVVAGYLLQQLDVGPAVDDDVQVFCLE